MKSRRWQTTLLPIIFFSFGPRIAGAQTNSIDSIITADSIKAIVEFLASDKLKGRLTGTVEAKIAGEFIANEFRKAGIKPYDESNEYMVPFPQAGGRAFGYNVIGQIPGKEKPSEIVIFSAHYDHIGYRPQSPKKKKREKDLHRDSVFNGANDNASGVAAMICLARYFAHLQNNNRTIIFIAFAGEEQGLQGSSAWVNSIKKPSSISCVINLEMLGRGRFPFITGSQLGNLRGLLNQELNSLSPKRFRPDYFDWDRYPEQKLFIRSDNLPFAKLKIPAHSIMVSNEVDAFYHDLGDESITLDYSIITEVSQAIALGMNRIIKAEITPNRIYIDSLLSEQEAF